MVGAMSIAGKLQDNVQDMISWRKASFTYGSLSKAMSDEVKRRGR